MKNKESVLKQAAEYPRDDILYYASKVDQSIWPPTCDSLQNSERDFPSTLNEFLRYVLKTRDHACSDSMKRLVNSYESDLIHGVTRGKVITSKHLLIGVGRHNITGLKTPVKILSHLGHSVDYNFVCETETAEAEKAQSFFLNDGTLQPLEPVTPEAVVLTYCSYKNRLLVMGLLIKNTLSSFPNSQISTTLTICNVSIPRSRRRSLIPVQQIIPSICVDKKKEPPIISSDLSVPVSNQISEEVDTFFALYVFWLVLRHSASSDQILPRFSGWCVNMQNNLEPLKKTIVTYLPPLNSPITEFGTVYKLFETLQSQASKVNMSYVNITLDVSAAINA